MKWEKIRLSLIEKLKETYEEVDCDYEKPIAPDQDYPGEEEDDVRILTDKEKYHIESEAAITFTFVRSKRKITFRLVINDWFIALEDWKEFTVLNDENNSTSLSSDDLIHAFDSFLKELSGESTRFKSDENSLISNSVSDELLLSVLELLENVAVENKIEIIAISEFLSFEHFVTSKGFKKPTFIENGISSYHMERRKLQYYLIKPIDKSGVFHQLNSWHKALLTIIDEMKKETPTISFSFGNGLARYDGHFSFYHNGIYLDWSILFTNDCIQLTHMYDTTKVVYEDVLMHFDKEKLQTFFVAICHKIDEEQRDLPPAKRYFDKLMEDIIRFDEAKNEIYQALLTYYEPSSLEEKIALNFEEKKPLALMETRLESYPTYYVKVANHYVIIEENENKTTWQLFENKEDSMDVFQKICEDELKKKLTVAKMI